MGLPQVELLWAALLKVYGSSEAALSAAQVPRQPLQAVALRAECHAVPDNVGSAAVWVGGSGDS